MLKTVIVSGGNISINFLKKLNIEKNFNNIIACDKGLESLDRCNIKPNYLIGDFDSVNINILNKYIKDKFIKIIKLNPEKDYTDTHMALKLAIDLESIDITIIGGIGTRLDHCLANINILKESLDKKIPCKLLNENNSIELINSNTIVKKENYKYVSLMPFTTVVKGVTLKGFKYPLNNAILKIGESIGVSNEQIEKNSTIELKEGILILFKTND